MKAKRALQVLAVCSLTVPAVAQPLEGRARNPKEARGSFLETLRQEDPEEFERLKQLRTEDPAAFKREIRRRRGQRAPGAGPRGDGPGARRGGQGMMRPGDGMGPPPDGGRRFFEQLRNENPEQFQELMRLRERAPGEFREALKGLLEKRGSNVPGRKRRSEAEQKCLELSRLHRETTDPAEKKRIESELREAVETAFDERLAQQKARLKAMEDSLAQMREAVDKREEKRALVCEERVKWLTRDLELDWEGR